MEEVLEVVVSPGPRLRSGNDSGNIWILIPPRLLRFVGLPGLHFFAPPCLLLLAFLLSAFTRALLLSDFGTVRHGELPMEKCPSGTKKGRSATGAGGIDGTAGSRIGHQIDSS